MLNISCVSLDYHLLTAFYVCLFVSVSCSFSYLGSLSLFLLVVLFLQFNDPCLHMAEVMINKSRGIGLHCIATLCRLLSDPQQQTAINLLRGVVFMLSNAGMYVCFAEFEKNIGTLVRAVTNDTTCCTV